MAFTLVHLFDGVCCFRRLRFSKSTLTALCVFFRPTQWGPALRRSFIIVHGVL